MNTFEAMYEDDHNQIEQFIPISNSQEDLPIMNENINIENELHNHHSHHASHFGDEAVADQSNIAKNISNLNQILSLTSFDDFNANNENHHHHHHNPHVIKMEKINFNNMSQVNANNLKYMINLNKISAEANEDYEADQQQQQSHSPNSAINFKLKDSSFGNYLFILLEQNARAQSPRKSIKA